jgi:hypothetical protein
MMLSGVLLIGSLSWGQVVPETIGKPKGAILFEKRDVAAIERDYVFACELAQLKKALGRRTVFRGAESETAVRFSQALNSGLQTERVKEVFAAAQLAAPPERADLWRQGAKDDGVPNWKCRHIDSF